MANSRTDKSDSRPGALRLGVFGIEGSFSEEAGLAWAADEGLVLGVDCELRHIADAGGLLLALGAGRIDRALLPLHNSRAGLVLPILGALSEHCFEAVGQVSLAVRQCLCLRSSEVDPKAVRAAVSHPHALAQCDATLRGRFPGVERIDWSDTASAARDLAVGLLPAATTVILASHRAAERFKLFVLDGDAQDDPNNRTSFCVFRRPR